MDAPGAPSLDRCAPSAPERQIGGLATYPSTWMPRAAFIQCRPPKVVPLVQQPSFVRVARHSPNDPQMTHLRDGVYTTEWINGPWRV
jgi:hypothetical protein